MKIAIIDQGVEISHARLQKCTITGVTVLRDKDSLITVLDNEFEDETGHGTAIAGIIHKIYSSAKIFAVKMDSFDNIITEDIVCRAIEVCIERKDVRIINLSLGIATETPSAQLERICSIAHENNILVVAAAHPVRDKPCYPAYFPKVFGVANGLAKNKMKYGFNDREPIDIIAYGGVQRIIWKNNDFRISAGTSYAAARFTGILGVMTAKSPTALNNEVRLMVKENSSEDVEYFKHRKNHNKVLFNDDDRGKREFNEALFNYEKQLKNVKKLAIFPISEKENKTILNFEKLSKFEITCLLDYPRTLAGFSQFQDENLIERVKAGYLQKEEFDCFDTLVVGYFLEQEFDANVIFGINLIRNCVEKNKNFIIWDKTVHEVVQEEIKKVGNYSGSVFYNEINQEQYARVMPFKNLPKVNVPTLAVMGTGSQQGKITVQLMLKCILQEEGYKVSHFATEPQAIILGAEMVFPYGYNSTIKISNSKWGRYIKTSLRGIQEVKRPDIIISGTQGGLIPRNAKKLDTTNYILSSLNFLASLKPDAVICSINSTDSFELIENTLNTVKIFCGSKPIFLAMTPWRREFIKSKNDNVLADYRILENSEMVEIMRKYQLKLNLPVLNIMDENNTSLILELIQNAFSVEVEKEESLSF